MTETAQPPAGIDNGTLSTPGEAEGREGLRLWQRHVSGMDGPRGGVPERPDDPVAYKLVDAAGDAIGRGNWQQGVNILRLVVKDYRQSQEAALARRVIDRLSERDGRHGR